MRLAKLISIIGHPMFMPLYAMVILFRFNPYVSQSINENLQNLIYIIIAAFTIVFPLLTALLLKKLKVISSLYMKNAEERKWPFTLTVLWYYVCFEILLKLQLPKSIYLMMIGAITVVTVALLVTLKWKISVHMLGIGGMLGALIGLSYRFNLDWLSIVLATVLMSGLVGFARLETKSHNPTQVYVGFIVGFCIEFIAVLL
jgi:hypothetical protein